MEEGDHKSKAKIIIFVILAIVIILAIILLVIRSNSSSNIISLASDEIENFSLGAVNQIVNSPQFDGIEREYTTNIGELIQRRDRAKLNLQTATIQLRNTGTTKIYDRNITFRCEDGTADYYYPGKFEVCMDSEGNSKIDRTENHGIVQYEVSGQVAVSLLNAQTTQLSLANGMLNSLQNKDKETTASISAKTLDILSLLSKETTVFGTLRDNLMREDSAWDKDTSNKIKTLESYVTSYNLPSKEEIMAVDLKQNCITLFEEVKNMETEDKNAKILNKASQTETCNKLSEYQKQRALSMREETENSNSVFLVLHDKIYLNLFTKCSDEWLSVSGEEKTCTSNIQNSLSADIKKVVFAN